MRHAVQVNGMHYWRFICEFSEWHCECQNKRSTRAHELLELTATRQTSSQMTCWQWSVILRWWYDDTNICYRSHLGTGSTAEEKPVHRRKWINRHVSRSVSVPPQVKASTYYSEAAGCTVHCNIHWKNVLCISTWKPTIAQHWSNDKWHPMQHSSNRLQLKESQAHILPTET